MKSKILGLVMLTALYGTLEATEPDSFNEGGNRQESEFFSENLPLDRFINCARIYSEKQDFYAEKEIPLNEVKHSFFQAYAAFRAQHSDSPEEMQALVEEIRELAPKAYDKILDWESKWDTEKKFDVIAKRFTEEAAQYFTAEDIIRSAELFQNIRDELCADEGYLAYRADRKNLKLVIVELAKEGMTVDDLKEVLNEHGLSSVIARTEQLYKYVNRA